MIKKKSSFCKLAAVAIVLLFSIIIFSGCQRSSKQPGTLITNSDGEVSVGVQYLGYKDNSVSFNIAMDTHSVNLDNYDLAELSELTDDKGYDYAIVSWDSKPGGHHRDGILTFSKSGSQGRPDTLILVIRNIAEIEERTFIWENI